MSKKKKTPKFQTAARVMRSEYISACPAGERFGRLESWIGEEIRKGDPTLWLPGLIDALMESVADGDGDDQQAKDRAQAGLKLFFRLLAADRPPEPASECLSRFAEARKRCVRAICAAWQSPKLDSSRIAFRMLCGLFGDQNLYDGLASAYGPGGSLPFFDAEREALLACVREHSNVMKNELPGEWIVHIHHLDRNRDSRRCPGEIAAMLIYAHGMKRYPILDEAYRDILAREVLKDFAPHQRSREARNFLSRAGKVLGEAEFWYYEFVFGRFRQWTSIDVEGRQASLDFKKMIADKQVSTSFVSCDSDFRPTLLLQFRFTDFLDEAFGAGTKERLSASEPERLEKAGAIDAFMKKHIGHECSSSVSEKFELLVSIEVCGFVTAAESVSYHPEIREDYAI